MAQILVIYATDYGSTKKMAEAVAQGVDSVAGASSLLKDADSVTAEEVTGSAGIIMGTPVHMGAPDWRVKRLIDTVFAKLWMRDALVGKVAGVFATGGGLGGGGAGVELALLGLVNNFVELGMVLTPFPKRTPGYAEGGIQWGPYARTGDAAGNPIGIQDAQCTGARHHGANVARLALALAQATVFPDAAAE